MFLSVPTDSTPDLYVVVIDSYVKSDKVNKLIVTGKPIAFFFNKYHNPRNSMQAEIDKVDAFKKTVKDKYCCIEYNDVREFRDLLFSVFNDFHKKVY